MNIIQFNAMYRILLWSISSFNDDNQLRMCRRADIILILHNNIILNCML
jgi:hypothetical protein